MRLHLTFATYISRQFLGCWFGVFLALIALIAMFDTIEIMRRGANIQAMSMANILTLVFFKLPHLIQKAIPFTILFGAMLAFWRLNRHHELVVARSAGLSAWEFLAPVLIATILIGVIKITVFSSFASAMMFRYEQLENKYFPRKFSLATLSGKGLWLRQKVKNGHYLLHSPKITSPNMVLEPVTIFKFVNGDNFSSRIDASHGILGDQVWHLKKVGITSPNAPLQKLKNYTVETNLTKENIQDSFANPETMSFWELPGFISVLENAGFSGLRHRLYWHSQLADPALLCAMVLFAAACTLRLQRRGGTTTLIIIGVATGVLIFFATDVVYALGLSARLPIFLAAWSPALVGCLLGMALLFHSEDG